MRRKKKIFKNSHIFQQTIKWKKGARLESRLDLPSMRVLAETHSKINNGNIDYDQNSMTIYKKDLNNKM